jgi:hypothetical protein
MYCKLLKTFTNPLIVTMEESTCTLYLDTLVLENKAESLPKQEHGSTETSHQKKTLQSIKTPTELSQAEMVMHHSDLSICSTSPVALQTKKMGSCSVPVACVHTFAVFSRSTPQHCQLLCIQKTLRYLQARQCVTNHSLFGDIYHI